MTDRITVESIPFVPEQHSQLAGVGKLSHAELEATLGTLLEKVQSLESELERARTQSGAVQRCYTVLVEGQTQIDLEPFGMRYTPGLNQLLIWGNDVKQYVGENYVEIDETHVGLTDPALGGEKLEILILPIPFQKI